MHCNHVFNNIPSHTWFSSQLYFSLALLFSCSPPHHSLSSQLVFTFCLIVITDLAVILTCRQILHHTSLLYIVTENKSLTLILMLTFRFTQSTNTHCLAWLASHLLVSRSKNCVNIIHQATIQRS